MSKSRNADNAGINLYKTVNLLEWYRYSIPIRPLENNRERTSEEALIEHVHVLKQVEN